MDWSKGWEARYYASFIDKESWRDIERFEITGGKISRSAGELIESADIEAVRYTRGEQWIRVFMDVRQNDTTEHIPVFTGLATSPRDSIDGSLITNSLECYSVLKPCQDVLLPRGWYTQSRIKYVLQDLLKYTPAPFHIADNIPNLKKYIVAEQNETSLSMIYKILLAINWRMRIAGDGQIYIEPYPTEVSAEFSADYDVLEPQLEKDYDWYECPNVFRAISEEDAVTVRDESESELSVTSRGREIWAEDDGCALNEGETLYEYAVRRLKDEQTVGKSISYTRRFNPNVSVGDRITINYPQAQGTYIVLSQNIELGYDGKTSEEAVR